jgi:hypothetical protein
MHCSKLLLLEAGLQSAFSLPPPPPSPSLARIFCGVSVRIQPHNGDGSLGFGAGIVALWTPCIPVDKDGSREISQEEYTEALHAVTSGGGEVPSLSPDLAPKHVATEAMAMCMGLGFPENRAWMECGGLMWREHWLSFETALRYAQDSGAVWPPPLTTGQVECPRYAPESLWSRYQPAARRVRVLEVSHEQQGCGFAEWYWLGHAGSSLTRVVSVGNLVELDRSVEGGGTGSFESRQLFDCPLESASYGRGGLRDRASSTLESSCYQWDHCNPGPQGFGCQWRQCYVI